MIGMIGEDDDVSYTAEILSDYFLITNGCDVHEHYSLVYLIKLNTIVIHVNRVLYTTTH